MDFLSEALNFAAKSTVVFALVMASVWVFVVMRRRSGPDHPRLRVTFLNARLENLGNALRSAVLERKAFRELMKERKKSKADEPKASKPNVYVLDFNGDLQATAVKGLRDEVTAITAIARKDDEVVVRLESPGGAVPHYGLAAAQLIRLKDAGLKVTACIDRVAASGGYMMACVADEIRAAPFAIVGSIGVVAEVPNVHRLLKDKGIDFEQLTAGEFKRTVSTFGEITPRGREKFVEQLEDVHGLFKDFVRTQRPKLEVDKVATGEYWFGTRALGLGLVDSLGTSDDFLVQKAKVANVYGVNFQPPTSMREKLASAAVEVFERTVMAIYSRFQSMQLR